MTDGSSLSESGPRITQLLRQARSGDDAARQDLMEVVYAELRRIARVHLRGERPDHTLQPTALVHETYMRLLGKTSLDFSDRAHFFAVVSQTMRRILVDHARARAAERRGGEFQRVTWDPAIGGSQNSDQQLEILDLDAALNALEHEKQHLAKAVELCYFGGMTAEEAAEVLGRSVHLVRHDLRLAQAWLRRELTRRTSGTGTL